jgi:hypothetical protein
MASIIERLTEGVVNRDLRAEGSALLSKWERTGLLEGIPKEQNRHVMARLLENQAKELLREASTMSGGDVEGFAAVAFPIVRRVFAGLIANDIVSVQPMSLPSGLIFFLDFTTSTSGAGLPRLGWGSTEESLYGGARIAAQITGGVNLAGANAEAGPYALNQGYASPTGSTTVAPTGLTLIASGNVGVVGGTGNNPLTATDQAMLDGFVQYDVDLKDLPVAVYTMSGTSDGNFEQFNTDNLIGVTVSSVTGVSNFDTTFRQTRRCSRITTGSTGDDPSQSNWVMTLVFSGYLDSTALSQILAVKTAGTAMPITYPIDDNLTTGGALGSVVGTTVWGLENNPNIPEIDIKVDSVAVTAITKKLKAKWTPELGQDLNAYHNLDAEVELTSILSEQIALEIDREILEDLIVGASAGTYYWSRSPGLFLERTTGAEIGASSAAPDFTGTVSEWYETLAETINDVSAQIHRKTLRGGANFIVCGPEVANVLEFTAGFRASVTADDEVGSIGAVKTGSLSKKFDVIVDPYFPRAVILVGRRGASFLESGYVYAPYVPLQTTPTIFGPEDFVPRKGVMTRYAKKMVRPDMYGIVVVEGLLGQAGATS